MAFHLRPCLLLCLPVFLIACGEPEDTRPGQPVKQRQTAFKEILRSFEPMGLMLRTQRYEAEAFSKLADNLASLKDAPWPHFAPDTLYPPSKATPAVWAEPERFARDREAFLQSVTQLQQAAQSKQLAQIEPAYKAVYDTCQTCHKTFKAR